MTTHSKARAAFTILPTLLLTVGCSGGATRFEPDSGSDPDAPADAITDTLPATCVTDAECDDHEPCNGDEVCTEDGCVPGIAPEDGSACATPGGFPGTCRFALCVPDTCGDALVDEGEQCDDGNLVAHDGCEMDCRFSCQHDPGCDDASVCTRDVCAEGGTGRICLHEDAEGSCDDSDPCTADDFCSAGVCVPGTPVCECVTDADCSAHDDDDLCNGTMACVDGVCVHDPDSVVRCDESPPGSCTAVACNPSTGSCETSSLSGVPCEDGDLCTGPDSCLSGTCVPGPGLECDATDPCVIATCDPAAGCVSEIAEGAECDDGDECTLAETCDALGACTSHASRSCDDGNDCTTDLCDALTGCYHTFNLEPCNDSDPCTTDDGCYMGHCVGDELPVAYGDDDGDGFGNALETVCTEALPEGFGWENGDCCDVDPAIFPGQPAWFTESYVCDDIGMPTFDYDCSGVSERRFETAGSCVASSGGTCVVVAGWLPGPTGTAIPRCGEQGDWLTSCVGSGMGCFPVSWERVTQQCH